VRTQQIDTPRGPAEVQITDPAGAAVSLLGMGHGAGGGVNAPDIVRVHDTAVAAGVRVARVTQPYRLAGRRSPAPANQLDEAWLAVVRELVGGSRDDLPLVVGGRSSGARVACRTAAELGAAGVLCLAFPLHPPGRPEKSRAPELPATVPTLVVNGDRDPFGVPEPAGHIEVAVRPGATHYLRTDLAGTAGIVLDWLRRHGWADPAPV
jgi:predicted alpha/beta-hydrolase family hydrolase